MKFIWGKKEFTLMIIPGANRRVIRIKLPQSTFVIIPIVIVLTLIGFFLTVYVMNLNLHETTLTLQQENQQQEEQFEKKIASQTSEMQKLQNELVEFSDQTDQFKSKLAEIQKLEHVILIMTENRISSITNSTNPNTSQAPPNVGGTEEPVSDEEWIELLGNTKTDLNGLVKSIEGLLGSLTDSEQKLAEAQYLQEITPTIWPSDSRKITSGFGIRMDPFNAKASMHTGLDIDGETGDNVYAAAEGTVIETGIHDSFGNYIIIDHTRGIQTKYMHLSKILVKKNDRLHKGDLIGLVGSTGRSTGSHLHYEVIKNNTRISPVPFLVSSRKED